VRKRVQRVSCRRKEKRGGEGALTGTRRKKKKIYIYIYINDERVWRLPADGFDVAELHFPRGRRATRIKKM
jgi:hypothetical protein